MPLTSRPLQLKLALVLGRDICAYRNPRRQVTRFGVGVSNANPEVRSTQSLGEIAMTIGLKHIVFWRCAQDTLDADCITCTEYSR